MQTHTEAEQEISGPSQSVTLSTPTPDLQNSQNEEQYAAQYLAAVARHRRRHMRGALVLIPTIAVSVGIGIPLSAASTHPLSHLSGLLMGLVGAVGIGLLVRETMRSSGHPEKALVENASQAGVHAIGPLIENRLAYMDMRYIASVYDLLIELLPTLRETDAHLLNRKHHKFLDEILSGMGQIGLSNTKHRELTLAVLEAYKYVGNAAMLPKIRQLAHPGRWALRAPNETMRAAAAECLLHIEARLADANATSTLLRASSVADAGGNVLLRVAQSETDNASDTLVRPIE